MKANELMIGDLVIFEDNVHKVTDLSLCIDGSVLVHVDGHDVQIFEHEISPIPLSEEILKANGFKNEGSYEWKDEIYVTHYRYWTEDFERVFELNFTPAYDGFTDKGFDVNEVHKLQHLLRLAEFNDLADNFKV